MTTSIITTLEDELLFARFIADHAEPACDDEDCMSIGQLYMKAAQILARSSIDTDKKHAIQIAGIAEYTLITHPDAHDCAAQNLITVANDIILADGFDNVEIASLAANALCAGTRTSVTRQTLRLAATALESWIDAMKDTCGDLAATQIIDAAKQIAAEDADEVPHPLNALVQRKRREAKVVRL